MGLSKRGKHADPTVSIGLPRHAEKAAPAAHRGIILAVAMLALLAVAVLGYLLLLEKDSLRDTSASVSHIAAPIELASAIHPVESEIPLTETPTDAASTDETSIDLTATTFSIEGVEQTLQYPTLPTGCELVALSCALSALDCPIEGIDVATHYIDADRTWSNAAKFLGSPFDTGGGGAFPPAIVAIAQNIITDRNAPITVADVSGTSLDDLLDRVHLGSPVLLWTTIGLTSPEFSSGSIDGYRWYTNEHCVVLYGRDGDNLLLSDPIEGLVERNMSRVQQVYEACGSYAVSLTVQH